MRTVTMFNNVQRHMYRNIFEMFTMHMVTVFKEHGQVSTTALGNREIKYTEFKNFYFQQLQHSFEVDNVQNVQQWTEERCEMRCDNDVLTWRYPLVLLSPVHTPIVVHHQNHKPKILPKSPKTPKPRIKPHTTHSNSHQLAVQYIVRQLSPFPITYFNHICQCVSVSLNNHSIVWFNTTQYNACPSHIKADDTVTLNIVSRLTGEAGRGVDSPVLRSPLYAGARNWGLV